MATQDLIFKLALIGDPGVGKTGILTRFSENAFSSSYKVTIGTWLDNWASVSEPIIT